jgi:aryl-alcohol dehydrogenase-like predicted oxidoreductase
MEYRPLGRTGAQVSALCLGCMNFTDDDVGGNDRTNADEQTSLAIMSRAIDEMGINFLDTANVYSRGKSETVVGKALKYNNRRDHVFLATKFYNRMADDDPNALGSHRFHIMQAVEDSLCRLQTDHIDLYQVHRPNGKVPIDETLRALDDLVRQGKVRYVGTSTFGAWQVVESLWASKELGLNRFVCEQPPYNLLDRRIERELLPMCQTYGIATIPWAPIAGGLLSGKYRLHQPRPEGSRYEKGAFANRDNDQALAKVEEYLTFCEGRGVAPARLALAWCLAQPGVTSPIIGPRTHEQMEEYVKALEITVTDEDKAALDAIFPPGSHVSEYYKADFGPNARWS